MAARDGATARARLVAPAPLRRRSTQDLDAGAVIEGVRQVVRRLRATQAPAVIVVNASAAGLYPVPMRAVYAAAKGAAVHLTRSLAHLHPRDGIRVCAVCPRFAETGMVARMMVRMLARAEESMRSPALACARCRSRRRTRRET